MPKLSTNVEEILLHAYGNFEEQSKVLEISIIIVTYCIIINDAHYSSVINAYCHYYISNKGLLEECNIKKKLEVTRAATVSCFRRNS